MRYVKTSPRRVWMSCTKLLLPIGLGFTLAAWLRINPRCRNFCWFLFSGLIFLHTDLSQLLGVELFFFDSQACFSTWNVHKDDMRSMLIWALEVWVLSLFHFLCLQPWETYRADLSIDLHKHHVPKTFLDKIAYRTVKLLRIPTDIFFQVCYPFYLSLSFFSFWMVWTKCTLFIVRLIMLWNMTMSYLFILEKPTSSIYVAYLNQLHFVSSFRARIMI